jgi:hypothetical protein
MGEMRLWNGSEFQLLRFLGRHRTELDRAILRNTNINPDLDYRLDWVDFWYGKDSVFDVELTGPDFLYNEINNPDDLEKKWTDYWPQTGTPQCWDAVINCTPIIPDSKKSDKWVIVEAKAHLGELESSSQAGTESREKIAKAFKKTQERFGIKTNNSWFDKYYQLANRLAFINFMLSNNIEVSLLNIYFIDGWPDEKEKNVSSKEIWMEKIKEEYDYLGINENTKTYISEIFIDCNGNRIKMGKKMS